MNPKEIQSIGEKLRKIIERHGWRLYDENVPSEFPFDVWPYRWRGMSKKGFAKEFKVGHDYLFVPIPKENQTLENAYAATMYVDRYGDGMLIKISKTGIGPSLLAKNLRDRNRSLLIRRSVFMTPPGLVIFTEISFHEKYVVVFTDDSHRTERDIVEMSYDTVVDTFRRYFKIITPKEFEKGVDEASQEGARAFAGTLVAVDAYFKKRKIEEELRAFGIQKDGKA